MSDTQDYGFWSRMVHRLCLGSDAVAETAFDLERTQVKAADVSDGVHVFVAGLARAGTTVLMRALYGTGQFRSLTYRDMPLVLAPNLWKRLSGRGRLEADAKERAHGDGVSVDFDSPEALEEVFWRVHCRGDYIREDHLLTMEVSPQVRELFRAYVAIVLHEQGHARYLSKNNNNLLRLAGIAQCFPAAKIIVPFRDPVTQADSLRRQHRHFCEHHAREPFARDYMTWLVHHEFGADHRPMCFSGAPASQADAQPEELDYWLQRWIEAYEHAVQVTDPSSCCFVALESLSEQAVWERLCERLQLASPAPAASLFRATARAVSTGASDTAQRASALYETLYARSVGAEVGLGAQ